MIHEKPLAGRKNLVLKNPCDHLRQFVLIIWRINSLLARKSNLNIHCPQISLASLSEDVKGFNIDIVCQGYAHPFSLNCRKTNLSRFELIERTGRDDKATIDQEHDIVILRRDIARGHGHEIGEGVEIVWTLGRL